MDAEHQQRRQRLEEASLPLMLDALWAGNVLDIETTLRHVCKKVGLLLVIDRPVWLSGLRPPGAAPALLRCLSCAFLQRQSVAGCPAPSQHYAVARLHGGGRPRWGPLAAPAKHDAELWGPV